MIVIPPATRGAVRRALLEWYPKIRRDLPWRKSKDPYKIWISEIMLQQTQVKTVLPYFNRFCFLFPTVRDLARADLQTVLKAWEGLGYYSRARHLHQAARRIDGSLEGRVPDDWERLRELPGIGDYTAAAVLSIAFDKPYAVVDGNVKRVLSRLFLIEEPVNRPAGHKRYQGVATQLLAARAPGDYNQAMMELGALVCSPGKPDCARCPLTAYCKARRTEATGHYPVRIKTQRTPRHRWVAAVIRKNGRLLLVKRPEKGLLGGLWEFPCYTADSKANPAAVQDRLAALLGIETAVGNKLVSVAHAYTHFKIRMDVYLCDWIRGRVRLNGPSDWQWIESGRLEAFPLHRAVRKALGPVRQALAQE